MRCLPGDASTPSGYFPGASVVPLWFLPPGKSCIRQAAFALARKCQKPTAGGRLPSALTNHGTLSTLGAIPWVENHHSNPTHP